MKHKINEYDGSIMIDEDFERDYEESKKRLSELRSCLEKLTKQIEAYELLEQGYEVLKDLK